MWSLRLCHFTRNDIMGQEFLVSQLLNVSHLAERRSGRWAARWEIWIPALTCAAYIVNYLG